MIKNKLRCNMDNLIDEFQAQIEMIKDNHYLTDAEIIKRYEDKIL